MTSSCKYAFLLAVVAAATVQTAVAAPCLRDNSDREVAVGRLVIGMPQRPSGIAPRPYILILAAPACLRTAEPADRVRRARTVHIFSSQRSVAARFPEFVGKTVSVRGRPMPPHTRHHRAPIIMDVNVVKPE
jgi:hypothetical protein